MTQHSLLDLPGLINRSGLCCSVDHICVLVPPLFFVQSLLSEASLHLVLPWGPWGESWWSHSIYFKDTNESIDLKH